MPQQSCSLQRECYPKLDLLAAKSAMERMDAAVCIFERLGQMIGQIFLPNTEEDSVTVHYIFAYELFSCVETEVALKIVIQNNPVDKFRPVFQCPICDLRRWHLYYVDHWACASCHGLLYRSQLVDKEVKAREERDELRALVKHGRPKGMHNPTYAEKRLRLAALETRLQGRAPKYASDEQDAVVTSRWVPGREIDLVVNQVHDSGRSVCEDRATSNEVS